MGRWLVMRLRNFCRQWAEFGGAEYCLDGEVEDLADAKREIQAGGVVASFEGSDGLWVDVYE